MIADSIMMKREKLYSEIWDISLTKFAQKYNLNYAKLVNSCKEFNIPYPTSSYWTKKHMGMDISGDIIPLPESEIEDVILYLKPNKDILIKKEDNTESKEETQSLEIVSAMLNFLEESEQKKIAKVIDELDINKHKKTYKTISAYKNRIKEERREERQTNYYNPYYNIHNYVENGYFSNISKLEKERCMNILSSVYYAIEELGGKINDDFSLIIRNELVTMQIEELKDKVPHELTKEEAKQLLEYEEKIKNNQYAWKPNVRKYDHIHNGKLKIIFAYGTNIKDTDKVKLEDKLGNILIGLYKLAEKARIDRVEKETAERKRQEEKEKENILKKQKKIEAEKILKLVNEAEDYNVATKIRAYANAVASKDNINDETKKWIKWAKEKADWYDPTVAMDNELLGKEHIGVAKKANIIY